MDEPWPPDVWQDLVDKIADDADHWVGDNYDCAERSLRAIAGDVVSAATHAATAALLDEAVGVIARLIDEIYDACVPVSPGLAALLTTRQETDRG